MSLRDRVLQALSAEQETPEDKAERERRDAVAAAIKSHVAENGGAWFPSDWGGGDHGRSNEEKHRRLSIGAAVVRLRSDKTTNRKEI